MTIESIWIRDTLVRGELVELLPIERRNAIADLIEEFRSIPYIDVRTQLGPSQSERMTVKQKNSITDNMLKVFRIEDKIKELLKTDEQLNNEAQAAKKRAIEDRKRKIQYRIRDIESYLSRKLNSNRENPTKKEYRELQTELTNLNNL